MVDKKSKKIIKSLIAVIVVLSAVATISIVYNFLGGFYYCRVIEYNKVLGEEQTIYVNGVGAFSCASNFSGSLVVGVDLKQPINIQITEVENSLYLRARFKVNDFNFNEGNMFGYSNWVEATDGYLYFNQPVKSYEKIGLCNTIKLNIQNELKSSTNYTIIFMVEASDNAWNYQAL